MIFDQFFKKYYLEIMFCHKHVDFILVTRLSSILGRILSLYGYIGTCKIYANVKSCFQFICFSVCSCMIDLDVKDRSCVCCYAYTKKGELSELSFKDIVMVMGVQHFIASSKCVSFMVTMSNSSVYRFISFHEETFPY
jgi:hypothetical protein